MSDKSTMRDANRSTKGVTAFVLSILLLTSAVAPAFAAQNRTAHESPAQAVTAPGVSYGTGASEYQRSDSLNHPAAEPGAQVTKLSNESVSRNGTGENRSIPTNATTTDVTLITGQTVTVVETGNQTQYRVSGDSKMHKVSTPNATYVFPTGVDFGKFDRHLFNVDFLVRQNLTDAEADSIPIIVSEDEREGVVVASGSETTDEPLDSVAGTKRTANLQSIDAAAGRITKTETRAAYQDLKTDDRVGRVTLDVKYRIDLQRTDDAVGSSDARKQYDVSGNNVKVAVLDTGIDESHPAIDQPVKEKDFTDETPGSTPDPIGHGTHVAGIIASDDTTYTGMAPNADLMDVRVLGDEGWGYTSWIVNGIEYATEQNADIISMSIGGSVTTVRSNDRYTNAINEAVDSGTLVVVSAGNGGNSGYRTISTPGIQSKALTVGASNASSGEIAGFSSRGPTPYGYYLKPDLVAPGVDVMSTASADAGYNHRFVQYSGTSMAAPTVSGIAALVLEKRPDWKPERVKSVLTTTSDQLGPQDVYTQGTGEVNATGALGTNVVVSPGTVDYGKLGPDSTVTRTITVENTGDSSVKLDVTDVNATNVATGESARDAVTLDKKNVSVGAGNTAEVTLDVDTTAVSHGVYSGRVEFEDGEYETIFGFARAHEVTVEKQALSGTSVDGDFTWLFAENAGQFKMLGHRGIGQVGDSTVTYRVVGGGQYNLISDGINEDNGQPIVFSREVTVEGDPTITLDEQNTTAYQLDTSEVPEEYKPLSTRNVQVTYTEDTSYNGYIASLSAPYADTQTVRFNADGEFDAAVEHLLVPQSATGESDNFSAEAVYHLAHRLDETTGTAFAVDQSELTQKRMTYYRNRRDGSYNVTLSATADFPYDWYFDHTVTDGLGDRRYQTIYLNDNVDSHGVGATSEEGVTPGWNMSTSYTTTFGSIEATDYWVNRHPYTGYVFLEFANGGLDYYYANPQQGRYHAFNDSRSNDVVRLKVNGEQVHERKSSKEYFDSFEGRSLSQGDEVELTVVGNNDATSLSTRTVTSVRTTYEPSGDNRPPGLSSVTVDNLTANNTVGETLTVEFVTDADATGLEAYAANNAATTPFDGDPNGWQAMSVENVWSTDYATTYRATLDVNQYFGAFVGRLDLAVHATDDEGNTYETTTFDGVRVDAKKPTVDLNAVGSGTSATGVPESKTVYTDDRVTVEFTADGTPGRATHVGTLLSADFANFETSSVAKTSDGQTWTTTMDLSDTPDDGEYTLEGVAQDRLGNRNVANTDVTVVLDRQPPDLGATIERAGNDGKVTLTSDKPLSSVSTATVEKPAGNDAEIVELTRNKSAESADRYVWDSSFSLVGDGNYTVTASGTDRAGNTGNTESTAEIESVETGEDKEVTVVLEQSRAFIEFRTTADVSSTVTVTRSKSALAPLTQNLAGLNFLNGQLGTELTKNLDDATIGIPVDGNLPNGIEKKQVTISYYNKSTGNWEARATSIKNRTVNGEEKEYWVTDVQHFSTYGAVAEDQQPPTVTAKSPDGKTLPYGTTQQTVRFDYGDDISGVDPSAVELSFDGKTVTASEAANVTGQYATYDATGLTEGTHTATLTVVDEAGNQKQYSTTFTVAADTTPPQVLDSTPDDGATLPAGTESVTLTVSFDDSQSGLDPSTAKAVYDDSITFSGAPIISGNTVSFDAGGLTNGSTHTLAVEIADNEGNLRTKTIQFSVAEAKESSGGSGSGGGGGGGGNVPPPSVNVEMVELTGTYAKAKVTSARSGSPGDVEFDGGLAGGDVTFRGLTIVPKGSDAQPRFFVETESAGSAPGGVAAFDGAGQTLGYLTVTPTYISDSELKTVGVEFAVDAAQVASPKNVALYRYDGGSWSKVQTKSLGKHGGAYRFEASADGTGTYAVGLSAPSLEVRNATLNASSVAPGDNVTVSATVENVGSGEGTHEVELVVDGETVATQQVTLAAGEQIMVEFTRTFEAGEHEISVGSADAGVLAVSNKGTSEAAMDDDQNRKTKSDGRGSDSGPGIPGFGIPAALAALFAVALLARRRAS